MIFDCLRRLGRQPPAYEHRSLPIGNFGGSRRDATIGLFRGPLGPKTLLILSESPFLLIALSFQLGDRRPAEFNLNPLLLVLLGFAFCRSSPSMLPFE
jgi:hypothetical protein